MTLYFDLSTSARLAGHTMGIVRVERELARWAHADRSETVQFCVYDKASDRFFQLDRDKVPALLDGAFTIALDPATGSGAHVPASLRRRARGAILRNPRLYGLFQRLRGRRFTQAEIAEIIRREASGEASHAPVPHRSLAEVAIGPIDLGTQDTVVSGGLDWEYKDLRAIHALKRATGFKYVTLIHDLIPVLFPHFVVPALVDTLQDYFGELPWACDYAICNSQCSEQDLIAYCGANGIAAPPSTHFPMGSSLPAPHGATVEFPRELEGMRYCLFVSTLEPRKNHRVLYQAWERALRSGSLDRDRFRMVFVGHLGWNIGEFVHEFTTNPWTRESIMRLERVSDALLQQLYACADFIVFPSFYEGYGLPLAEALALGKPCLTSGRGALREVAGDLVRYAEPDDAPAWSQAIVDLFGDPADLERQSQRIAREYAPVSWRKSAEIFFERLTDLMSENAA